MVETKKQEQKEVTIKDLKSQAYDYVMQIEAHQQRIRQLTSAVNELNQKITQKQK